MESRRPVVDDSSMALITWILMGAATPALPGPGAAAPETYRSAIVDSMGQLRIVTSRGRQITPRMEDDQVGFTEPAVSRNRRAVGWLALFPNAATSYPVPLELVILATGRQRTYVGLGLMLSRWTFTADGRRVAFREETVHGGFGVHYQLHDVATGRRLAEYEEDPEKPRTPPAWVRALDALR